MSSQLGLESQLQTGMIGYDWLEGSMKDLLGRVLTIVDATYPMQSGAEWEQYKIKYTKDLLKTVFRDKINEYSLAARGHYPYPEVIQ